MSLVSREKTYLCFDVMYSPRIGGNCTYNAYKNVRCFVSAEQWESTPGPTLLISYVCYSRLVSRVLCTAISPH